MSMVMVHSLDTDTLTDLARRLWALGDPVRLEILRRLPLKADCEHRNNVSELALQLGLSQPSVSHHLRILRQAGLIHNRRMCRDVFYWRDEEALRALAADVAGLAQQPEALAHDAVPDPGPVGPAPS